MKLNLSHLYESLSNWIEIHFERKYLMIRLVATRSWFIRMGMVSVLITILMSVVFSLCTKTDLFLGVELGLFCSLPMLFLMLVPFLLALFIVEITGSPQPSISMSVDIPSPYLFFLRVYLQVPLSPPRVASRSARQTTPHRLSFNRA